ncbi:MAG: response regulator [Lachnospiraceae bacterium]|nr:response regulator [Lachnospiraceae bacterium]
MMKLLIVEDEKIELDTLKNYVDWKGMGIDQVFTARGGRSALECINSEEPDILLTDIQMPGMTGLDLVEIIRQEEHDCKVVLLTGYDKFEYAKEAVRLKVDDFLLKPFQIDELENVITRLISVIQKERKEKELNKLALGKILEKAFRGEWQDMKHLAEFYAQKPAEQLHVNILALYGCEKKTQEQILQNIEVLHAFYEEELFYLIFPDRISPDMMLVRLNSIIGDMDCQVIINDSSVEVSELFLASERLRSCRDDLFYREPGAVISCSQHVEHHPYEDRIKSLVKKNLIFESILVGNDSEAEKYLIQCLDQLKDLTRQAFCQNAFSLFLFLHRQLENVGSINGLAADPYILRALHYQEVKDNFVSYIRQCCRSAVTQNTSRWSSYVKRFVMLHYAEDFTVDELAEGANVSPNYLRRKFKEETGITILEYVTETRLAIAARLLRSEGDRKVKDISIAVGYPNISYFTQLFSKKYGVTPNEYKKMER